MAGSFRSESRLLWIAEHGTAGGFTRNGGPKESTSKEKCRRPMRLFQGIWTMITDE